VNLNTMMQVRHQIWHCFERSADALFELVDALSSEPSARSLPELSLSSLFQRKWSSVYEALSDGQVDQRRWSEVWTRALLCQQSGPVWISIDSTSIARPEADTSPDRGMIYVPNLPHANKPVSVGWQFSTIMLLPETKSSWGAILSQRRIKSCETAVEVAIQQLESLVPQLPEGARVLADRWHEEPCFASSAIANCIGLRHRSCLAPVGRSALMERCFRGVDPRPGARPRGHGREKMRQANHFRCKLGLACTSARRGMSR
jgi:hypothetical protein